MCITQKQESFEASFSRNQMTAKGVSLIESIAFKLQSLLHLVIVTRSYCGDIRRLMFGLCVRTHVFFPKVGCCLKPDRYGLTLFCQGNVPVQRGAHARGYGGRFGIRHDSNHITAEKNCQMIVRRGSDESAPWIGRFGFITSQSYNQLIIFLCSNKVAVATYAKLTTISSTMLHSRAGRASRWTGTCNFQPILPSETI